MWKHRSGVNTPMFALIPIIIDPTHTIRIIAITVPSPISGTITGDTAATEATTGTATEEDTIQGRDTITGEAGIMVDTAGGATTAEDTADVAATVRSSLFSDCLYCCSLL